MYKARDVKVRTIVLFMFKLCPQVGFYAMRLSIDRHGKTHGENAAYYKRT